jgi:molybdate transport system substrate-binding protein
MKTIGILLSAAVAAGSGLGAPAVRAADLAVLSAGAVEPGIRPALAAFEAASGNRISITFAAAPQIVARMQAGEAYDLVVVPAAALEAFAQQRRVGAERVAMGQVGIGVAVRADSPTTPAVSDADSLRRDLLAADAVVYNRASTGIAFEGVLEQLGISGQVEARAERPADGAGVMERLRTGYGREIGVGAITEILLYRDRGVRYVGPLPGALQRFTVYTAAVPTNAPHADAGRALLAHLSSPTSKATFAAAGVAPMP